MARRTRGPISGFSTGNHFVQYRATDNAGRVEADAADRVQGGRGEADGDDHEPGRRATCYPLDKVVKAKFKCTDNESGMDTCVGTVANGANLDTSTIGAHTFTVTGTDKAGNVTVVTHHYTVVYTWNGFFSPISNTEDIEAEPRARG